MMTLHRLYVKWRCLIGKGIDIWSKSPYPSNVLSNLHDNPFEFDGVKCGSMEGFLQSLKYKDAVRQKDVCAMAGKDAKNMTNADWQVNQIVWWQGQEINRQSKAFQELVMRAYQAMMAQNETFRMALLSTKGKTLYHSKGNNNPYKTILTRDEFCKTLMELRSILPATFIKAIRRAVVIPDKEELPIKYVDEAINVDCLRGRLMGLLAEVSKRTDQPITLDDDILKEDNIILNAFARVINVVTKEELRVIDVLLDEVKRMSESEMGKESDNETIRALQFIRGWRNETNKVFEAGGSMYDLLTFTSPDYMNKTMDAQSVYGYRGKLEGGILEKFKDNESGKYGLRDKNANVVIAPDYDEIEGSVWVGRGWTLRQGDKWGAVNERGEWMFPVEYDEINTYSNGGHKLVKDGKVGYCNSEGVVSVDFLYDTLHYSPWDGFEAELDGRWGLVDYEGNVIIPFEYDYVSVTSIGNNKFITVKKDGKWGCVDDKGNVSVPFEYDYISSVESIEDSKLLKLQKNGKWGCVDDEWNVVFPFEYDSLSVDHFGDGKIVKVEKDGKYGYCNARGEVVIPIMYDDISGSWNSDVEAIVEINDKYGVINSHNQMVLPIEYERVRIDPDNIYRAKKNGLWGVIDKYGNVVFPFKYRDLGRFDENGLAWACDDSGLYGYVYRDGNVLIPFRYHEARDFVGQYAVVGMGRNERGLIDKNGRVVVPLKYSIVLAGYNDIVNVIVDEKGKYRHLCGLYDLKTGNMLPCEYEAILSWRRDSDGILECKCRKDRDSFPVVVKVS